MTINFQFEYSPMIMFPPNPQPPCCTYTYDIFILDGINILVEVYLDPYNLSEHIEKIP
jgi:hypothetical protein